MEFVAVVVGGDDVKEEDVLSFLVQPAQSELHLRKHLPRTNRRSGSSRGLRDYGTTGSEKPGRRTHKTVFLESIFIQSIHFLSVKTR